MAWLQMHFAIYIYIYILYIYIYIYIYIYMVKSYLALLRQLRIRSEVFLPTLDVALATFMPFDRNNFDVVTVTFCHELS